MKKSRFTESHFVAILKEGEDGMAVAQLARKQVQYVPGDSSLRFADARVTPSGCVWWTELPR